MRTVGLAAAFAVAFASGSSLAQETGLWVSHSTERKTYSGAAALAWYGGQGELNPSSSDGHSVVRNTHGAGLEIGLEPPRSWGLVATLSGALQSQSDCQVDTHCPWPGGRGPMSAQGEVGSYWLHGRRTEQAWQARVGYRFSYFTVDAGVHGYTDSAAYDERDRSKLQPAISFRWGSGPNFFRSGLGPYSVPTLFGLTAYLQGQFAIGGRAAFRITNAVASVPHDYLVFRLDGLLVVNVTDGLDLGLGAMTFMQAAGGFELRWVTSYAF